jgi:uncharacterized protein (UPF0210 family)
MKIRALTAGFNLRLPLSDRQLRSVVEPILRIRGLFRESGCDVQTVRLATQPWETWGVAPEKMDGVAADLADRVAGLGIDYLSMGTTRNPDFIPRIRDWLARNPSLFATATVGSRRGLDFRAAAAGARLMRSLAGVEPEGLANLRFAALFNTGPGSPFFPAAWHRGARGFSLGLENSDMVAEAFGRAEDIRSAGRELRRVMAPVCRKLERTGQRAAREAGLRYAGMDVSIAPSVAPDESLAYAFEKLGLGRFGEPGTLAAAKVITDTLRSLPVSRCGYSGLMMPVLEDAGLAERNAQGTFNLGNLMAYSAVCGTGLDTIPLPGDVPEKTLYALLLDLGALSDKLKKPLSARLMPIPGRAPGDKTVFDFPYFVNTAVMPV